MAEPPKYSGRNIIKFRILPGGSEQYYYDTELKEKEYFQSQKISEKQSLGKCCKVKKKLKEISRNSIKVTQGKGLVKIQYFVIL